MTLPVDDPILLFVDDEPLIRKYFQRAFGDEFKVRTADSSDEAHTILDAVGEQVGVLVTDQRMPGGDGVSLLRAAKVDYAYIVRLLTTAYADVDEAIKAVNEGEIWRYITKPWNIPELRKVLAAAVDVYRTNAYEQALLAERRRGMLQVASHIAHEMRTPLQTIQSAAVGIENYLPTLLAGHDWAIQHGADIQPISNRHRQVLEGSTRSVQRVVDRANSVIDLLLGNAGAYRIDPSSFTTCGMADCVTVALEDFPFTSTERDTINWAAELDFAFHGSVNLMILVLHNLLRNALRATATAGGGNIELWIERGDTENALHIKDTGTGIAADQLTAIFDDFASFSNDDSSAGIGLGFCRKVMTSFGGRIHCHSEKHRYTQFDLWLPTPITPDSGVKTQ